MTISSHNNFCKTTPDNSSKRLLNFSSLNWCITWKVCSHVELNVLEIILCIIDKKKTVNIQCLLDLFHIYLSLFNSFDQGWLPNIAITGNSNGIERYNYIFVPWNNTSEEEERYTFIHEEQDVIWIYELRFKYYLAIFQKNIVLYVLLHKLHISEIALNILYFSAKIV